MDYNNGIPVNIPMFKDDDIQQNLLRSGHYFMLTIWIQSQMTDLVILNRNPGIVRDFISDPTKIPTVLRDERYVFWKKDFSEIKKMFEQEFANLLTDQAKADLNTVFYIRNAIAHSHVSLARPYLFYVPGTDRIDEKFRNSIDILNKDEKDLANPPVILINFSKEEIYSRNLTAIQRLGDDFFEFVCKYIGIPHSRIR